MLREGGVRHVGKAQKVKKRLRKGERITQPPLSLSELIANHRPKKMKWFILVILSFICLRVNSFSFVPSSRMVTSSRMATSSRIGSPRFQRLQMADDQEVTDLNLEEMFDVFEAADKEVNFGETVPQKADGAKPTDLADEKQSRVFLYIGLAIIPCLFLIPMVMNRDFVPASM